MYLYFSSRDANIHIFNLYLHVKEIVYGGFLSKVFKCLHVTVDVINVCLDFFIDLEQDGFTKNPFFHGIIAEVPEQHRSKDGHTKVGYALYFYTYSSWKGRAVYMEDLYVMPEFRAKGIGKALMSKVAQLGLAAGCTQLNFAVLNWNKPSLNFYLSQGCFDVTSDMGYHCMRCEGDALEHLAQG
uniref:Diamine acetyltransferase 2 n=1 Tax=Astyanax mexicanus TaxID=7994 RepID=A0A8B9HFP9_ASTMX